MILPDNNINWEHHTDLIIEAIDNLKAELEV